MVFYEVEIKMNHKKKERSQKSPKFGKLNALKSRKRAENAFSENRLRELAELPKSRKLAKKH